MRIVPAHLNVVEAAELASDNECILVYDAIGGRVVMIPKDPTRRSELENELVAPPRGNRNGR